MSEFLRLLFNSLESGSVYALAALAIVLIFRTSDTVNFAQGMIGTINAYIAAILLINLNLSIWLVALISLITAFLTGIIIDTCIIRPAAKVSAISKQIITLGIIMVLLGILPYISNNALPMPRFIDSDLGITISNAVLRYNTIFIILLSVALMGGMFWFIRYTKWGLATRVTASDENTAKLMGVPTKRVTMVSWAFAASLGTLAALFVAPRVSVQPNMLSTVQLSAFFAGTLGGFNTFFGPVLGAYIISFTRNFFQFYISDIWGSVIVYTLILVFLYFKPYGIFGKKPTTKV